MKIKKFNQLNEDNDYTSGFKVKIKFDDEMLIDFDEIKNTDRYLKYSDDSIESAIFIATEQYLYENGDIPFTWELLDDNGEKIEDVEVISDLGKYNI